MSKLTEFYDEKKVPADDRISTEKNILLVVADKKQDIRDFLNEFGIAYSEVSLTWPKTTVDIGQEIEAFEAKVVLQVDCSYSYKYPTGTKGLGYSGLIPYKDAVIDAISDMFVGLHHHDEFSIKDGLGSIGYYDKAAKKWTGLIGLLKAQNRSFCSITNHGSVGGWIKQYNACKNSGIKAIFGMEAYVSNYRGDDPELKKAHRSANHLVLIANTEEGFFNIIRIHNDAQLNGFYYTPRVNREALEKWGKGIIGMSACMAGELPRLLMADKPDEAKETYEFYNRVFDKFYVEIQIIEMEEQREANRRLINFARSVGAPLVLTCDSHYLDSEYAESHDVLMCLRQKKTIVEKREKDDVWSFDVRNLYYRDAGGMYKVFDEGFTDADGEHKPFRDDVFTDDVFCEAMDNTRKIALGTQNIVLDSTIKLPRLYDNGKEVLRAKVNAGFAARGLIKKENSGEYLKRIKSEFEVITRTGWGDYFLVMERIITDTRAKFGEWAVGYGRGSAAGSLVSYCLGLTGVDPVEYGLLFERFLEEGRPDPPDIDTDFDPRVRDWVKQHIVEVFGANNVCSIGTYATYKTRAVILDVARTLGENLAEVSIVTKRIEPLRAFEDDEGVEQKVDQMDFEDICKHYPELQAYFELHPEVRRHAEILRNQVKNMGTHAGGVIISDLDLRDRIPVLYDKPSSETRQVISAWAESGSVQELSSVGLVKYDILGLKNLPIISDCIKLIEKTTGQKINREDIPISDRESIYLGSKRDLVGIFQFENPQTKPIADAVGMESLDDVAAITSLIRPGPMDADIDGIRMPLEYARRKKGGEYLSPDFIRKALSGTYSLIVYQEDVMRISRVLSGFTAAESNKLRKACISIDSEFVSKTKGPITLGRMLKEGYKNDFFLRKGINGKLEWGQIGEIWKTGKKRVRRTKTRSGYFTDATRLHQFLTDDGWKAQQRLSSDDRMVCARRLEWDGKNDLSRDISIVIAGLVTEGYTPAGRNMATFVSHDPGFMSVFVDAFESEFGKQDGSLSPDGKVYRIRKTACLKIFKTLGKGLSGKKFLPDTMMSLSIGRTRDFLSFMLGAEGGTTENSGQFEYSSKSERMIRQVRNLLLRFGVRSLLGVKNDPVYGRFHRLFVNDIVEQKKMLELTHLWPVYKREAFRLALERKSDPNFTTDTIPHRVIERMINQYPSTGRYESGTFYTSPISRTRFDRAARRTGDQDWIDLAESDFWFDEYENSNDVVSISMDVYDFSALSGEPNMIVNGMVIHNCGKNIMSLMISIKEKFVKGAQSKIDAGEITLEEVELIWETIEKFAGYGFNKSVDINSPVLCNGEVKKIGDVVPGDIVVCFDGTGWVKTDVVENHDHGILPAFEVTFSGGEKVVCSILHKFETAIGKVPLWELMFDGEVLCGNGKENLEVQLLSGSFQDKENASKTQDGKQNASVLSSFGLCRMQGMSGEIQQRDSMPKTSSGLSQGKRDYSSKQVAESHGEHTEGSRCSVSNDIDGTNCQGSKGGTDCGRNVKCDCHKKKDIGEIESYPGIQTEGVTDSDSDLKEGRLTIAAGQESKALGNRSSTRVLSEFAQGEKSLEEFEVGRMAMEGITIAQGSIPAEDSGSLHDDSQRSGFCESGDLDRGGRVLAFRNGLCQEEVSGNKGSREGYPSESRSGETRDSSDSVGDGLLEREREIQTEGRMVEDLNESFGRTRPGCVSTRKVLSARFVGFRRMCDLEVSHSSHNYVLANGIVSSNSHAVSYGAITTVEMWLKHNFPIQYITALVNNTKLGKKKPGSNNVLVDYINYARRREIEVLGPDINKSGEEFRVEGDSIRFAIGTVKNVAKAAKVIESFQPFTSMADFYDRVKVEPKDEVEDKPEEEASDEAGDTSVDPEKKEEKPEKGKRKPTARRPSKKVVESLIAAGAFNCFGNRNEMMAEYYKVRKEKELPEDKSVDQWNEAETEVIGLCLSRPILYKNYEERIRQEGWYLSAEVPVDKKKVLVFGEIVGIKQHISKAGNSMHIVFMTDGIDTTKFFVFQGGWDFFKNNFVVGTIGVVPLSKFDDGDGSTRFFDERGKPIIIKKV